MVGHGGSSAGSYLADPTSPIPSHCASIVVTSTLRVIYPLLGVLRVRSELTDRARDAPYILFVRAQDGGGLDAEVVVEVYVEDAQSQEGKPRFRFPAEDGEVVTVPEVRITLPA